MPASCVVGGCTRTISKNPEIHFVRFPKNPSTSTEWVHFVRNTRSDFKQTKWSMICSAHFTEDCLDDSTKLQSSMGITRNFKLKPGSVPSLKAPTIPPLSAADDSHERVSVDADVTRPTKHSGAAFKKRQRTRVGMIYISQFPFNSMTNHSVVVRLL